METKPKRYKLPGSTGHFSLLVAPPGTIKELCEESGKLVCYVESAYKRNADKSTTWSEETERLQCKFVNAGTPPPTGLVEIGSVKWAGGNYEYTLYAAPWGDWVKATVAEEKAAGLEARVNAVAEHPEPEPEPEMPAPDSGEE